jgi:sugar/nucleoside kinase (ribokinase family)
MRNFSSLQPVDYMVIGHITQDLTSAGPVLGGTAAYSALTAQNFGLRVGIVTSYDPDLRLPELEGIPISARYATASTTFKNTQTEYGRIQHVYHPALSIDLSIVPDVWINTPIVHLGPILQEVDPKLAKSFRKSFIGITPQGWLRGSDATGKIGYTDWPEARYVLEASNAAVISIEDVVNNEGIIDDLVSSIRVLAVTEGAGGVRLYWNGDLRTFRAPIVNEVDPTGAGDIFATAFFIRLHQTRDPWEAARFANLLAATSVTRRGLAGIPTPEEIKSCLVEILP